MSLRAGAPQRDADEGGRERSWGGKRRETPCPQLKRARGAARQKQLGRAHPGLPPRFRLEPKATGGDHA
eukprot:9395480-Alexandrium_andersonii.AAC.1